MNQLKTVMVMMLAVAVVSAAGCGGGGSSGGGSAPAPSTPTSMKEVTAPVNSGVVGGFVYASQQNVAVDIVVPTDKQIVTIYDKRPTNSPYDASGKFLGAQTVTRPIELARGLSKLGTDGKYHYKTTIIVPTAATSVYIQSYTSAVVLITSGKVSATFAAGGVI